MDPKTKQTLRTLANQNEILTKQVGNLIELIKAVAEDQDRLNEEFEAMKKHVRFPDN